MQKEPVWREGQAKPPTVSPGSVPGVVFSRNSCPPVPKATSLLLEKVPKNPASDLLHRRPKAKFDFNKKNWAVLSPYLVFHLPEKSSPWGAWR